MTTKQAENINKKFLSFRDTINFLSQNLDSLINKNNLLVLSVKDSFNNLNKEKLLLSGQMNWYKKEYYELQDDLIKEMRGIRINMNILLGLTAIFSMILVTIK